MYIIFIIISTFCTFIYEWKINIYQSIIMMVNFQIKIARLCAHSGVGVFKLILKSKVMYIKGFLIII